MSLTGKLEYNLDVINVIFKFLVNLQYDYDMPYVEFSDSCSLEFSS